jgi:CheY-like chemotaxis protein
MSEVVAVERKLYDRKPSILIFDDESELAELMLSWARLAGHSGVVLHSADNALTLLRAQAFDVLLTDIVMSGYSRETATNRCDVPWSLLAKPFGWPEFSDALESGFTTNLQLPKRDLLYLTAYFSCNEIGCC